MTNLKNKYYFGNLVVAGILSLTNYQPALAFVEDTRCKKDFAIDNLTVPKAQGRVRWAAKCYPELKTFFRPGQSGGIDVRDSSTGKLRAGYPVFAKVSTDGNIQEVWSAPVTEETSCEQANKYNFVGFCVGGCYTPDQYLLFDEGYRQIGEVKKSSGIVTLTKDATFENVEWQSTPLDAIVTDPEPQEQEILKFSTLYGGEIKVTTNHPLVDGEGKMRAADTLKVGESLVTESGVEDPIVKIDKVAYFGKVYNVRLKSQLSSSITEKIVSAQGFLNGSIYFQNQGVGELNRQALRRVLIPATMFEVN